MSWIDILLVLVMGFSIISGAIAGFARVGVGFIATLFGIFLGFWCYGIAAGYVLDYVSSRSVANLIGFFVIFFAVVLIGAVIGRLLARLFKWIGLTWLDRVLGAVFGFVRGFIMAAAVLTMLLAFAPSPLPRSVLDSKLMPYMLDASNVMAALTPHEVKEAFREAKDNIRKAWSAHKTEPPQVRHE